MRVAFIYIQDIADSLTFQNICAKLIVAFVSIIVKGQAVKFKFFSIFVDDQAKALTIGDMVKWQLFISAPLSLFVFFAVQKIGHESVFVNKSVTIRIWLFSHSPPPTPSPILKLCITHKWAEEVNWGVRG